MITAQVAAFSLLFRANNTLEHQNRQQGPLGRLLLTFYVFQPLYLQKITKGK